MSAETGWRVLYGCEQWQDEDADLTEEEARSRYDQHCFTPPTVGLYTAEYVILRNPDDDTIDSYTV